MFGGSWGSTLALAYAQAHPDRVLGLVLRGIFLATRAELDWFMHGIRTIFPEAWRAFAEFLPEDERGDLLASYYRRLTDADPGCPPARRARVGPLRRRVLDAAAAGRRDDQVRRRRRGARDRAHRGALLRPPRRSWRPASCWPACRGSRHLPCTIVQGRYDIVCPPVTAEALARAWPEAEYVVVPDAGHSVREPGITRELVAAVRRMQRRVGCAGLVRAAATT